MRALLDVNVMIALLTASHIHHQRAAAWLEQEMQHGWASCPITQNGCLRIMSQPAFPGALPVALVAERLGEAIADPAHAFWPDDISLLDSRFLAWSRIMGHRQVTDAYLLALAARHEGCFVTFDRRITASVVPGAQNKNLVVL